MKRLIQKVVNWADEKGILKKATPLTQVTKTFEEVHELQEALYFQANNKKCFVNRKGELVQTAEEIKDAIGDIVVTLIIQAELQNLDFQECVQSAYEVIKNRTGKMVNGTFVKD